MGSHFFLQAIFLTQRLNRDQTQVSHVAGSFFTTKPQGNVNYSNQEIYVNIHINLCLSISVSISRYKYRCQQIIHQSSRETGIISTFSIEVFTDNALLKVKVKSLSCVPLFVTPWTVAYHARPSMGFSRQESWSGLSLPSPEDLPDTGIEPGSPALQADALLPELPGKLYYMFHQR